MPLHPGSPHRVLLPALAAISACLASPALRAGEWTASVALTSDYLVRGLRRSADQPAAQAHVGFVGERGWAGGISASTVRLPKDSRQEIDLYASAYLQLSRDWRVAAQLTHYEFLDDSRYLDYDYTELATVVSYRDVLALTAAFAPRYSGYSYATGVARNRRLFTYELSGRWPLTRSFRVIGGIGHSDLHDLFGESYRYWNGGVEFSRGRLKATLAYVGTDATATRLFRREAADTWVATVAWRVL